MRLIDADALRREVGKLWETEPDGIELCKEIMKAVNHAPTIDAVPVMHGRWINLANGNFDNLYTCSECKEMWLGIGGYNYCPNCGTKMDGKKVDE